MPVVSNAHAYRKLQSDDVAWKLLHSQNAPFIIAILDEHLGGEVSKRSVAEMNELVEYDIQELGERIMDMPLSRSAKDYLEQWRRDGYLIRKPSAEMRQETYELSGGALSAISFVKKLAQPRRTATKSRLGIIFDQITDLSIDVSANDAKRREMLLKEREEIDEKLRELDSGQYEPIDDATARERTEEIIGLAKEIPLDFAYVSAEFERISKALYAKLISFDESQADLLADVFAGVDHIGQSPEGQSFRGFYDLLQDFEESERFYDNIDIILNADFAQDLPVEQRQFLRHLMQVLLTQSRSVNETMTDLARSLRRFVQSQSFQEDRALKRLLDKSLAMATELTDTYPVTEQLPLALDLTSTRIEPISRQKLRNPADDSLPPESDMELDDETPTLSLEELRAQVREVEIDFEELASNVNDLIADVLYRGQGSTTIGDVLKRHPATQGVASIVGLMMLADEQGRRTDGVETIEWDALDGTKRRARIEQYEFIQEVT